MSKHTLPCFSLKVLLDEAKQIIQDELDANNWGEIEVPIPKIELIPYYVFHYDAFSESEEEKSKIRNVEEAKQGTSSLNAIINQLDDVVAELTSPELIQKEFSEPKGVKAEEKEPRFPLEEAKVAAQIKIAAHEKVPRANVHISGMRLVYFPFWVFSVELDVDQAITLRLNAVTGEFDGEVSGIPYQGKTKTELLRETVSELQNPGELVGYVTNFIKDFVLIFRPSHEHPNRWIFIGILVLIAIILIGIGFVKLPAL